jgi:hypothetical protein
MMKHSRSLPVVVLVLTLILSACVQRLHEGPESGQAGELTFLCDAEMRALIDVPTALYKKSVPKATINLVDSSARGAMSELFAGKVRGVIVARDYLQDEREAITSRRAGEEFPRSKLATDALVLVVSRAFPTDTVHVNQVTAWLTGAKQSPPIPGATGSKPPTFIVPGVNSSLYANLVNVVLKGKQPSSNISAIPSRDEMLTKVRASTSLIGVGYLSQFAKDSTVKMLKIGFSDSAMQHVRPKPVHQGYVIQDLYPYPVPIYIYLQKTYGQNDMALGYTNFLARDGAAQRSFLDAGIVPDYARIELNVSE